MLGRVEIKSVDTESGLGGWEYLDDLPQLQPVICRTVGFLLEDDKEYKIMAQSVSDTQVHGRIAIPAMCIKSLRRLK